MNCLIFYFVGILYEDDEEERKKLKKSKIKLDVAGLLS
jgi:hypothetical protein